MSKNYPQFKLKLVRIFRTMLKLAKRCRWAATRLLPVQQESQTCQNGNGSRQLQLPDVEDEGVANLHGCGQSASGGLAKSWQMNIHNIESYGSKSCRLLLLKGIPSEAWNILNPAWPLFLLDSKSTRQEAEKVKRWEKTCAFSFAQRRFCWHPCIQWALPTSTIPDDRWRSHFVCCFWPGWGTKSPNYDIKRNWQTQKHFAPQGTEDMKNDRRKFRSQTSNNMDRWKAEMGRGREKRRVEESRSEKRKSQKKMQMREKVGKSRNTVFFQWFVAPEGRKVGSLKRRVRSHLARWEMKNCTPLWRKARFEVKMLKTPGSRSTFGSWDVEKVQAVVARSTFRSQNVLNTICTGRFWRFRCRFAWQAQYKRHVHQRC